MAGILVLESGHSSDCMTVEFQTVCNVQIPIWWIVPLLAAIRDSLGRASLKTSFISGISASRLAHELRSSALPGFLAPGVCKDLAGRVSVRRFEVL